MNSPDWNEFEQLDGNGWPELNLDDGFPDIDLDISFLELPEPDFDGFPDLDLNSIPDIDIESIPEMDLTAINEALGDLDTLVTPFN